MERWGGGGRENVHSLSQRCAAIGDQMAFNQRGWNAGGGGGYIYIYTIYCFNPVRGRDSSVVRAPDSLLKGRGFESLLERRENFLLQGRLSVLTLISVSVPPPCYHSST